MAGQRYKPGVLPVTILGVERPMLGTALALRGMALRAAPVLPAVALVAADAARPLICPVVVQANSADHAGALLDGGADDVVLATDPDSLVAARLAAAVRRARPEVIQVGRIAIDTLERRVSCGGEPLVLLPREYALLLYLARHVGRVVDHASLHRALWDRDFDPGTNVIAVHLSRLRGKLGNSGVAVVTERGRGYRLVVAAPGQGG